MNVYGRRRRRLHIGQWRKGCLGRICLSTPAEETQGIQAQTLANVYLAMEHNLPILVFDFKKKGNFQRAVQGEDVGTLISNPRPPREKTK